MQNLNIFLNEKALSKANLFFFKYFNNKSKKNYLNMKEGQDLKEAIEFINSIGYNHLLVIDACNHLSIERSQLSPKASKDFMDKSSSKEMAEV